MAGAAAGHGGINRSAGSSSPSGNAGLRSNTNGYGSSRDRPVVVRVTVASRDADDASPLQPLASASVSASAPAAAAAPTAIDVAAAGGDVSLECAPAAVPTAWDHFCTAMYVIGTVLSVFGCVYFIPTLEWQWIGAVAWLLGTAAFAVADLIDLFTFGTHHSTKWHAVITRTATDGNANAVAAASGSAAAGAGASGPLNASVSDASAVALRARPSSAVQLRPRPDELRTARVQALLSLSSNVAFVVSCVGEVPTGAGRRGDGTLSPAAGAIGLWVGLALVVLTIVWKADWCGLHRCCMLFADRHGDGHGGGAGVSGSGSGSGSGDAADDPSQPLLSRTADRDRPNAVHR